jgi:hypothetical protein
MPNADHYRRQAEVCRQLASDCSEHTVAERLQLMAMDFAAQAEEAARAADGDDDVSDLPDLHIIGGDDPTGGDIDRD